MESRKTPATLPTQTDNEARRTLASELETYLVLQVHECEKRLPSLHALGLEGLKNIVRKAERRYPLDYREGERAEFSQKLAKLQEGPLSVRQWSNLLEAWKDGLRKGGIIPLERREDFPKRIWDSVEIDDSTKLLRDARYWYDEALGLPYKGTFTLEEVLSHCWWREWYDKSVAKNEEPKGQVGSDLHQIVLRERVAGIVALSIARHRWNELFPNGDSRPARPLGQNIGEARSIADTSSIRGRRWSEAEKKEARKLRAKLWTYGRIGRQLKRSRFSVRGFLSRDANGRKKRA